MVNLTISECGDFNISKINYDEEEAKIRERNINLLYDLIRIIKDNNCLEILRSDSKNYNNIKLPNKFITFYKRYYQYNKKTSNQKIVSIIKSEYKDLMFKVQSYSQSWLLEEDYTLNAVLTNSMFSRTFAKDPGKQTFHQHFAAQWLTLLPFVEEFQELPSGGNNALYVYKGKIVEGKDKKKFDDKVIPKSIDFSWKYRFKDKTLNFYATHKHTKLSGGSQDNQYRDVQDFHLQAKQCIDTNLCFLSITDGPYYLLDETTLKIPTTKLKHLNSPLFKGKQNFATNIDNFIEETIIYIIKWLESNFIKEEIEEEVKKLNILKNAVI